jgi:elongation factor P--(R)-beta-lysine ligase
VSLTGGSGDWAPACSLESIRERARMLAAIRRFFDDRGVLEVETPILSRAGATDPNLTSFRTALHQPGQTNEAATLYLQTSPEFAMKRMLAAGIGSIYQICKAFRDEEQGRHHNPEFTLLEWYRLDFGLDDLIAETDALVRGLFEPRRPLDSPEVFSYRGLFSDLLGIDPLDADFDSLDRCARTIGLPEAAALCGNDRTVWLDLLFAQGIQPRLGLGRLSFVMDFPAILPSLARNKPGAPELVERVEVYLEGIELANGFHELQDAEEQNRRFKRDLRERGERSMPTPPKDHRLLAALHAGLPDCSGIALGLDRLLMLLCGAHSLEEVLPFPIDRA